VNLVSFAARNLARNKIRTALTVAGAAVAVLAFVLLRTVLSSWHAAADVAAKDRLETRDSVSFVNLLPKRYVDQVRATPGVKVATWANWFGGKDPAHPREKFASFAVDPASYLDVYDEIQLSPEEREAWLADRQGAIVGDALAKKLGLSVGDSISLESPIFAGEWRFHVKGIYKSARRSVDRSRFIFHWNYLNGGIAERVKEKIGWIISRAQEPGSAAEMIQTIDRTFETSDVQTRTMSENAITSSFLAGATAILGALDTVSLVILVIMGLILGNTVAMGVRERTREYGVMRAIGFTPTDVRTLILGEAVVTGIVAGMAGIAASYPLVQKGMGHWFEENMGQFFPYFRISAAVAFGAILLSVTLAAGAAMVPALQASRLSVVDALRRLG
jgi:putative ABC transport system permease protein